MTGLTIQSSGGEGPGRPGELLMGAIDRFELELNREAERFWHLLCNHSLQIISPGKDFDEFCLFRDAFIKVFVDRYRETFKAILATSTCDND